MSEPLPADVLAALEASNKIEAIRLLRVHTGIGLHDAKVAVESGALPTNILARPALPKQLPAEVIAALQRGSKIDAVKLVRAKYGVDLKDAKAVVDAAEAEGLYGRVASSRTVAPGDVSSGRFGAALLLLAVVLALLSVWWLLAGG
jgi:ribosomal protein L7/L12